MLRRTALAVLALLLGVAFARAQAGDPPPAPPDAVRVLEHDVAVRLIPSAHKLIAEDRLLVEAGGAGGRLDLVLHADLALRGPVTDASGAPLASERTGERIAGISVTPGRSTVVVRYEGIVFDAVQKAGDLTWVAGDGTKGLVSEKGVYLASSSRWIPTPADSGLARYHVKAYVPEPFHVVTQGAVPTRSTVRSTPGGGPDVVPGAPDPGDQLTTWNVLAARAVLPTDGLQLVAGPYKTKERAANGVTFATWFYESEAADADLWLDAMEAVVKRYAGILGPYPHAKFDIVENFFQTGWGMPSFTLLGDQVIQYVTAGAKRTGGKIPPGYLDHEYVHGWYGNGLFVDYAKGNWCEALTTYCSNYLAKELECVGQARAHRRGVLEKFSMRVKGAKDTPVRAFQEKTEDTDNDIGYGKGSLIFHLIRRRIGDATFWKTLRDFTQKRVGTYVSWDDFLAAFDAASGSSVSAHVKPYLERQGLPRIAVSMDPLDGGDDIHRIVHVRAEQLPRADGGPPFPLFLPIRIEGVPEDERDHELDLSSGSALVGYVVSAKPRAVVIDPEYHALRQIEDVDLPPCLERTLGGSDGVVVLTGGGEKSFGPLADQIAATKGFKVVGPEFDLAAHAGAAVVLSVAKPGGSITLGGSTYDDPAIGVLRSTADGGVLRTTFTALSEAAAERAGRLPFYGWDPWVVFRSGRPIARDARNQERPSTRFVLDDKPTPEGKRVKSDIEILCSSDFDGRRPGTKGHDEASRWLSQKLQDWSGEPQELECWVEVQQLRRHRDLEVLRQGTVAPETFRPFWLGQGSQPPVTLGAKQVAVVPWDEPGIDALLADLRGRDVHTVIYALSSRAEAALAPWLDTVDDLTDATKEKLAKRGRDGRQRAPPPLPQWLSGRRARQGAVLGGTYARALAVDPATGARLKEALADGAQLAYEVQPVEPVRAQVLYARRGGTPPPIGHPIVLLTAHYDSFGPQPDRSYWGADDNGSGVACLLEVLRLLPKTEGPLPCEVAVVFTDAEEWGLLGSRAAVGWFTTRYDVRAVINVDAVGRAVSKPTHILGLSRHPALARLVCNALEEGGIVTGPDIDAYGYEHGSDHWPFHQAGIPAVSLWASDYGVMDTPEDTPEKVEPEGVAKIAAALARLLREDLGSLAKVKAPAPRR